MQPNSIKLIPNMKLTFVTAALFITLTQAAILHNHIPPKARGGISRYSFAKPHTHTSWHARSSPRVKNAYETLLAIFNGLNARHHPSAYYAGDTGATHAASGASSRSQGPTSVVRHGLGRHGRTPHGAWGGKETQDGQDGPGGNGLGEGVNGCDGDSAFVVGDFRVGGNGQDGGNGLRA